MTADFQRFEWTTAKEDKFIAALARGLSVTAAAKAARIGRTTCYERRAEDPDFKARWEDARDVSVEELEEIAYKRARASSDTMLIFLLKARKPEIYKDRHDVTLAGGIEIKTIERKIVRPKTKRSDG